MADDEESISKVAVCRCLLSVVGCIILTVVIIFTCKHHKSHEIPVPMVDLACMSFAVVNITETRLSARWSLAINISSKSDLAARIPNKRDGYYFCHQGDFQASFLYKNVTLVTSSPLKYKDLQNDEPQLLAVPAVVYEKDISGSIGKDMMEDIKEKKVVKFGSQFTLSDCKQKRTVTIRYVCDEATLRFKPGSEIQASVYTGLCVLEPPKMH